VAQKRAGDRVASEEPRTVRASVSLRAELYHTLEALAKQKRVSTAWVLRDAAEKYVAEQWPLFGAPEQGELGRNRE
jgi:predicted DNA-binding protein